MRLVEVAQILSIVTSAIAVLVSLFGFARFFAVAGLRSRNNAGTHFPPAWSTILDTTWRRQSSGAKLRRIQVSTRGREITWSRIDAANSLQPTNTAAIIFAIAGTASVDGLTGQSKTTKRGW